MAAAVILEAHDDGPLGGLKAHWRAWRRRDELDALLIRGADPSYTRELACRAAQLTRPSSRDRLARELQSVLAAVEHPATSPLAIDLCLCEARVARPALAELARCLRERRPCSPRGVAMCRRLLRDPASPLFTPAPNDELWRAARAARHALDLTPGSATPR